MAKRFGVMLDCSRNAVMKPEQIKEYVSLLQSMGYNMLMLYTEDTYKISDEPYFGYLRGGYTEAELKEIAEYCHQIGVEVIPAIQTLAHIDTIFRWGPYKAIHDIDNVMLAVNCSYNVESLSCRIAAVSLDVIPQTRIARNTFHAARGCGQEQDNEHQCREGQTDDSFHEYPP